ncbi:uncharacterized protein LOC111240701 isoform X2 [Vigna radiata var. radiata]|uniref:Uncharacterized protein LOC111240701 isoform X2 n=1 Tax=Vigna radiata var. radiata TaxID=3916 RepID=A0A3Q0EJX9_VIGRR|nr:uncharacterized protein LOC111240701 isoform X2 [Vigna radiata var. radiata]
MATCSLISTRFHSPSSSLFRSSTIKPSTTIHLSKTLHLHTPNLFLLRLPSPKLTIPLLPKLSIPKPLLLLCTSLALSFTLLVSNADSAAAFVVTSPRKLQSDELATVRLFQENTPSVVCITNLAVKQDAFTLDVLEVHHHHNHHYFSSLIYQGSVTGGFSNGGGFSDFCIPARIQGEEEQDSVSGLVGCIEDDSVDKENMLLEY